MAVPGWGPAFWNFALHRFCVALRMTHEAGLKPDRAVYYSFRATANTAFQNRADRAISVVKRGGETRRAKLFYLRNRVGKAVRLTEKRKGGKKEAGDTGAPAPEAAEKSNPARELAASAT